MEKELISLLKDTRRLLDEEGWCQGSYYGEHGGYCINGVAFDRASALLWGQFCEALGFKSDVDATEWNDAPGRTKEEVLARIDRAIATYQMG